jgi:hypothetical protein
MITVYLILAEINGNKLYKIGYTKRSVEERIKEFKTGNASEFYLIDSFTSQWGTKIESNLHRRYISKKVSGEWFNLTEEDLVDFKKNCEILHNNFKVISENNTYILDKVESIKNKSI